MINTDALDTLLARYNEVMTAMSTPEVASDPAQLATLGRELSGLEPAVRAAERWRALITTRIEPPRTEAELMKNPLGLKIEDISWTPDAS